MWMHTEFLLINPEFKELKWKMHYPKILKCFLNNCQITLLKGVIYLAVEAFESLCHMAQLVPCLLTTDKNKMRNI